MDAFMHEIAVKQPRNAPSDVRFWRKVDKAANDNGCWLWTGCRGRTGYGRFTAVSVEGPKLAHRVSWEMHNGPIPPGMYVLHRCDVTGCVNPAHLFVGTQADNIHDMIAKGRSPKAWGR